MEKFVFYGKICYIDTGLYENLFTLYTERGGILMAAEPLTLTTDLQPEIIVKSRAKENYADALSKTKAALYEKMHNIVD